MVAGVALGCVQRYVHGGTMADVATACLLQNDPGETPTPHIADPPAGPFDERPAHEERRPSQHATQLSEASAPGPSQPAPQPGPLRELPGPRLSTGKC